MFWRDEQEPIISSNDTHGDSTLTYISQDEKLETHRWLNSRIVNAVKSQDLVLRYKTEEVHMVAEAMNRVPMYCNLITSLGYKNILFIGHFNTSQYKWLLDRKEVDPNTRMYDCFPPERNGFLHYPDPHILFQFIPIFMKHWGYEPKITFARPPESRHKGIIHHLYNLFPFFRFKMLNALTDQTLHKATILTIQVNVLIKCLSVNSEVFLTLLMQLDDIAGG